MNKRIFVYVMAIIFFIPLFSAAKTLKIKKGVLERILQRQNELEEKIEELRLRLETQTEIPTDISPEKTIEEEAPTAPPLAEDMEYLKDEVAYMSDRLDRTERKSILDKMHISGEFRVRADWLNFDNIKGADGAEKDGRIDELWSSRLRLNLRSEITESLIFNGRLSYLKYWGETSYNVDPIDRRYYTTSDPDGGLHVERAYIDWFIPDTPFSLTFGRLPVADGPPYEFKNNTTRKSTWVQSAFDGEYDGIIFNANLERWTSLKDSMFRAAYSKINKNYHQYEGFKMDDVRGLVLTFDTPWPGIKNSLLWFSAYRIWDLRALNNLPNISSDAYPPDSGELEGIALYLQFANIKGTGLGWFGAFVHEWIHPRPEGTIIAPGYEVGLLGDSLHGDLGEDRRGYSFSTGVRYILPIAVLNNPHIGLEYLYNSQYFTSLATFAPGEFTNKMGVNGQAYEFYYLQPIIEKRMFARIGAIYQDFDYYSPMYIFGSREGDGAKSDMSILNTYFLMDVRF